MKKLFITVGLILSLAFPLGSSSSSNAAKVVNNENIWTYTAYVNVVEDRKKNGFLKFKK